MLNKTPPVVSLCSPAPAGDFLDYAYTGGRRPLVRAAKLLKLLDEDDDYYDDEDEDYYDDEEDYYYDDPDDDVNHECGKDDHTDEDDDDYYYYYDDDDDTIGDSDDFSASLEQSHLLIHDNVIHKKDSISFKDDIGESDYEFKVKGKLTAQTQVRRV